MNINKYILYETWHFTSLKYILDEKLIDKSIGVLIRIASPIKGISKHAVCCYTCNGKYYYYDNTKTIIEVDWKQKLKEFKTYDDYKPRNIKNKSEYQVDNWMINEIIFIYTKDNTCGSYNEQLYTYISDIKLKFYSKYFIYVDKINYNVFDSIINKSTCIYELLTTKSKNTDILPFNLALYPKYIYDLIKMFQPDISIDEFINKIKSKDKKYTVLQLLYNFKNSYLMSY